MTATRHDPPPGWDTTPTRGQLPAEALKAARTIHRKVWGSPYRQGQGPMHHAGGPYWKRKLLMLADEWERLAAAARIAARYLPDEEAA